MELIQTDVKKKSKYFNRSFTGCRPKREEWMKRVDLLEERICSFVCWLFNVKPTSECISGTDLLRQVYVLPH